MIVCQYLIFIALSQDITEKRDGHFVPLDSFSPQFCVRIRKSRDLQ
jgi:hypothetical protein